MKQVIFNVGGALSTYIEYRDKRIVVDLGKSDEFNPVTDFLLPLFKKRGMPKNEKGLYSIDQCIISHPHNDHISSMPEFEKMFAPALLTCPNSNEGLEAREKINWKLIGNEDEEAMKALKRMLQGRRPPLRSSDTASLFIYYLPPVDVEETGELKNESYPNNISIVTVLRCCGHTILMPGDIQKEGMKWLLKYASGFRKKVREGVDVLIAPHHGLKSAFSVELFDEMPDNKVRCLTVVSEKIKGDDDREVDSRYSTSEFCKGQNSLSSEFEPHYQVKTSRGHIYIDYEAGGAVKVEIITDVRDLLRKFT